MNDFSVLKKLAQDANEQFPALEDQWSMVCTPSVGLELLAEIDRLAEEYDKAWRHDLNDKNNVQVLTAEVVRLNAEIDRLRTAEGDAMTYKAGMENVAQQRDQLKQENRLLTEHNEFLASSDSRLAPDLRAVKDALGLDFTASVSGEVVPLIERLRKLPTCWTEVLEQSEANDQLLDQVLELSKYADRWKWLEGSADSATWEQIGHQEHMNRHLHVDAAMAKGK